MNGGIFVIRGDEELVAMSEQPYDSEDLLQALLAKFPSLLAGDQVHASPRRWLLVGREASLPSEEDGGGRWSVDHLFLDDDAVPTLVEVKRSSDTRIRREVVGQMLDYAANAVVYWPVERLRSTFEASPGAEERMRDFLNPEVDPDEFWQQVGTNLMAGKVRLVFVADVIPPELRRVVEFLNTQMNPADVLAVEIKQYVGEGMRTLVPRIIGQTEEAQKRKGRAEGRQWDEPSFLEELERRRNHDEAVVAREIIEWSRSKLPRPVWVKGDTKGGFSPELDYGGHSHSPFTLRVNGRLAIRIVTMRAAPPPFDQRQKRLDFLRLSSAVGLDFDEVAKREKPNIELARLVEPERLAGLLATLDWFVDQVKMPVPPGT